MIKKQTSTTDILKLTHPCQCATCNHGCNFSSGFLADGEKKKIAKHLNISEEKLEKEYLDTVSLFNKKLVRPKTIKKGKPYGKCVFFKDGCSIHPVKPLECTIAMPCKEYGQDIIQWFLINHAVNTEDPESIRQWKIFLNHNKPIPGAALTELVPNKQKLKKILSYDIL